LASLLLQEGAPITCVSQQLGHRDAAITFRVYAHWLPNASTYALVNRLDDAASDVTQASPARRTKKFSARQVVWNPVVSRSFASWNQIGKWLRRVEALRDAA
jgi:hypothetical protein